jgi:hypothetical protein
MSKSTLAARHGRYISMPCDSSCPSGVPPSGCACQAARGTGEIAVAVARYLVDAGVWGQTRCRSGEGHGLRALRLSIASQLLTPATSAFIDGFGDVANSARLWALLSARIPTTSCRRWSLPRSPAEKVAAQCRDSMRRCPVRVPLCGRQGLPERHRTVQIRSLVDRLVRYPYRIDTSSANVRVIRGGRVERHQQPDKDLYVSDIVLSRPLRQGETASIEYETLFSYTEAPPPEFRRAARGRVDNLELYLQFHRSRLPRSVWWTAWDDYRHNARIVDQERTRLDSERSVHRYLPYIERTVVGFRWDW